MEKKAKELFDIHTKSSVETTYNYLKTEIYPILRRPHVTISPFLHVTVANVLKKLTAAKKADMTNPKLPTVAQISLVHADLGSLHPREWSQLVGPLIQALVSMKTSTEDYPSIEEYEKYLATRATLLTDLLDSWKVLSAPPELSDTNTHPKNSDILDDFWFPTLEGHSLANVSKNNFAAAFTRVLPQYPRSQLGSPVAALAIATYCVLQDRTRSNDSARRRAARFMGSTAYVITYVELSGEALKKLMKSTFPGLEHYVMDQWSKIRGRLEQSDDSVSGVRVDPESPSLPSFSWKSPSKGTYPFHYLISKLNQAYLASNMTGVDRVWQQAGFDKEFTPEHIAVHRENSDLIDLFVNVYMAMNKPEKALAAWGLFKKIGKRPTLKTWNAMLDGCKKAHNLHGLKNIWAKLASSGAELDTAVWTTRVAGLVECGDLEGGLQVLEEMVKLWNHSQTTQRGHAVKPTIEPVNAALAALIRRKKPDAAERLLAWAASKGIERDIFTYNTLLRPMIREERRQDVKRLFAAMKNQGVSADAATFTIVLDAALARIEPPPASSRSRAKAKEFERAQQDTVALVLSRMEAAGLETNLQTYGKMIYLLLQSGGDRSSEAIKAVMAHLWSQGHELSPHIYTMLVEHYFSRRPPDLEAVDSLLERRRVLAGGAPDMDRVFYDRVIRGYAVYADQPTPALDWYYHLTTQGYQVTAGTRAELLRALLRHGRWDDARGLVADARERLLKDHGSGSGSGSGSSDAAAADAANAEDLGSDPRDDAEASYWRNNFWAIAESYGLVDHDVPSEGGGDDEVRAET